MLSGYPPTALEKRDGYFNEALEIFTRLESTGWDPGYVQYRLAQLNRIRGDFRTAKQHAECARSLETRDVFEALDKELELIELKDDSVDSPLPPS
jgi:hypothetical protein